MFAMTDSEGYKFKTPLFELYISQYKDKPSLLSLSLPYELYNEDGDELYCSQGLLTAPLKEMILASLRNEYFVDAIVARAVLNDLMSCIEEAKVIVEQLEKEEEAHRKIPNLNNWMRRRHSAHV